MANPSLQIGNSNWAIKKDNLLGYSTAGTRFLPIPITMTRASAGTRVNPQGLVETVELLGSEEITNGNFATNTDWTLSQTTIANDKATVNSTSAYGIKLTQATTIGLNKTYKILFTVADVGANINFKIGFGNLNNGVYSDLITTAGTYEIYLTQTDALAPSQILILTWSIAVQTFSITNISVKESTKNDLARVDYTGSTSSLLAEPQRTNEVTYSEDFSNAYFQKIRSTISPDQIVSPDGTQNADKFIEDSSNNTHLLWTQDYVVSIGDSLTWSVFAKKGERDFIVLQESNAGNFYAFFDLDNGVIGTTSGVDSSKIEDLGSGWYRCSITYTTTGTTAKGRLYLADSNNSQSYQGNGTSGLYIWGAQLEEGSYATSYIPTSGSTVTRVQDQYSKTGISDKINSEEGVLFIEAAALSDDGTNRYISISDGTASNYIYFRFLTTSNRVLSRIAVGGVTINGIQITITDTTAYNKYAIKWKSGDYAFWINGVEVGADTSSTIFGANTLNQLKFSFPTLNGGGFPSKVKQLQVFKTALTDSELATLTTI